MISICRLAITFLIASTSWAFQSADDALNVRLSQRTGTYSLDAESSLRAFAKIAGDFRLPMGIEWVKRTRATAPFSHTWQTSTLKGILQDVVTYDPEYQMEIHNGVVRVFPKSVRTGPGDILDVNIGTLRVTNEYVRMAAYRLALQTREIVVPHDAGAAPISRAGSIATGAGDQMVSFVLENATVRDVLDRLCLSAGLNVWVVTYPQALTKTRTGFFKTSPLNSSAERKDEEFVPDWAFLQWGNPIQVSN